MERDEKLSEIAQLNALGSMFGGAGTQVETKPKVEETPATVRW